MHCDSTEYTAIRFDYFTICNEFLHSRCTALRYRLDKALERPCGAFSTRDGSEFVPGESTIRVSGGSCDPVTCEPYDEEGERDKTVSERLSYYKRSVAELQSDAARVSVYTR